MPIIFGRGRAWTGLGGSLVGAAISAWSDKPGLVGQKATGAGALVMLAFLLPALRKAAPRLGSVTLGHPALRHFREGPGGR